MEMIEKTIETPGNGSEIKCLSEVLELDRLYNEMVIDNFQDL